MPCDDAARREHARRAPRYASDLTDREWALIAPFLPPAASGRTAAHGRSAGGRERDPLPGVERAAVADAAEGLAADVDGAAATSTTWRDSGLWQTINHLLVMERAGTGGSRGQSDSAA